MSPPSTSINTVAPYYSSDKIRRLLLEFNDLYNQTPSYFSSLIIHYLNSYILWSLQMIQTVIAEMWAHSAGVPHLDMFDRTNAI